MTDFLFLLKVRFERTASPKKKKVYIHFGCISTLMFAQPFEEWIRAATTVDAKI